MSVEEVGDSLLKQSHKAMLARGRGTHTLVWDCNGLLLSLGQCERDLHTGIICTLYPLINSSQLVVVNEFQNSKRFPFHLTECVTYIGTFAYRTCQNKLIKSDMNTNRQYINVCVHTLSLSPIDVVELSHL